MRRSSLPKVSTVERILICSFAGARSHKRSAPHAHKRRMLAHKLEVFNIGITITPVYVSYAERRMHAPKYPPNGNKSFVWKSHKHGAQESDRERERERLGKNEKHKANNTIRRTMAGGTANKTGNRVRRIVRRDVVFLESLAFSHVIFLYALPYIH